MAAGALVWAIAIGCLGFLLGTAVETIPRDVRRIEGWIVLGILGVGAVVWMIYFLRKKRAGAKGDRSKHGSMNEGNLV
ncbi:MAG: hypothetical protein ABSC55_17800 [Syntrophorhabdales bacterium]|jgi:membrane protein DedA with SNARE-associated domain